MKMIIILADLAERKPKLEFWVGDFEDVPELFTKIYEELKKKGIFKNEKILEGDKRGSC